MTRAMYDSHRLVLCAVTISELVCFVPSVLLVSWRQGICGIEKQYCEDQFKSCLQNMCHTTFNTNPKWCVISAGV